MPPVCSATAPPPRTSRRPPSSALFASARASIQAGEAGAPWLFGIARNAALDELRRRGRQAELVSDPIDTTSLDAERSEQRLVLVSALGKLDPRERELIALKFFAGLSNTEIADVLGINESNAGTKLHRAVTKLREVCDGAL